MTPSQWLIGMALMGLTCLFGGVLLGQLWQARSGRRLDRRKALVLKRDLRAVHNLVITAQETLSGDERESALASAQRRLRGVLNETEEELKS